MNTIENKTNKLKKVSLILISFVLITFLTSFILAFGVSSPYMENRELKMAPGETKDLQFVLQNSDSQSEITARAEILEGSQIAEITDSSKIYTIPAGGKATVNIRITIPKESENENIYKIRLGFSTSGEGGFFSSAVEQNFNVVIDEDINKIATQTQFSVSNIIIYTLIGIIILALVIFFILRKRSTEQYNYKRNRR